MGAVKVTNPGPHSFFEGAMLNTAFGLGAAVTCIGADVLLQPLAFVRVTV
jgi:sulfite exporter TauE/SafE